MSNLSEQSGAALAVNGDDLDFSAYMAQEWPEGGEPPPDAREYLVACEGRGSLPEVEDPPMEFTQFLSDLDAETGGIV